MGFTELTTLRQGETSHTIRSRVLLARDIQASRFREHPELFANAQMGARLLREICVLDAECTELLRTAMDRLNLSARAYDRILKVARTIADLDSSPAIRTEHLAEAIQFRSLDRESWGG